MDERHICMYSRAKLSRRASRTFMNNQTNALFTNNLNESYE